MPSVPEELTQRLRAASEQCDKYQRLADELVTVERDLVRAQQLADRWSREVGTLAEQLRERSGFRPVAFLRGLFGSCGIDRRDLERQLRDSKDEHDDADAQVPPLEARRQQLRAARSDLEDAPDAYAAAIAAKESWLREQGDRFVGPLNESAALIQAASDEKQALDALVSSGRQAEGELLIAKQAMQEARAAGGSHIGAVGVFVGDVSHSKFVEARRHMDRAEEHLRGMSEEMDRQGDVLRRIASASASEDLTDPIDRVRQAVWAAEQRRKVVARQLVEAQSERARWIEQAG